MSNDQSIRFMYVNYKGEANIRDVKPIEIWYGTTEWHPEEQWFLKAFDYEKKADRDFVLKDMDFAL